MLIFCVFIVLCLFVVKTYSTKYAAVRIGKLRGADQGYYRPIHPQQSDTRRQARGY